MKITLMFLILLLMVSPVFGYSMTDANRCILSMSQIVNFASECINSMNQNHYSRIEHSAITTQILTQALQRLMLLAEQYPMPTTINNQADVLISKFQQYVGKSYRIIMNIGMRPSDRCVKWLDISILNNKEMLTIYDRWVQNATKK